MFSCQKLPKTSRSKNVLSLCTDMLYLSPLLPQNSKPVLYTVHIHTYTYIYLTVLRDRLDKNLAEVLTRPQLYLEGPAVKVRYILAKNKKPSYCISRNGRRY